MRLILGLVFSSALTWGAACVATATGNWNSAASWTSCGGGFPVNGDTVTIGAGITITIPVGVTATVGDASATAAISVTGGQSSFGLIVSGELRLYGDISQNNRAAQVTAGAIVRTYSTTKNVRWLIGIAGSQLYNYTVFNGTAGSRITVGKEAAALPWGTIGMQSELADAGQVRASYTDFSFVGGATVNAFYTRHYNATATTGYQFYLDNCSCTNCGRLEVTRFQNFAASNGVLRIKDSTFRTPVDANGYWAYVGTGPTYDAVGTGQRLISGVAAQGVLRLGASVAGQDTFFTITDCIFDGYTSGNNSPLYFTSGVRVTAFERNMVYVRQSGAGASLPPTGTLLDCLLLRAWDGTTTHVDVLRWGQLPQDTVVDGFYVEHQTTNEDGAVFALDTVPAVRHTLTVRNTIVTQNGGSGAAGTLVPTVSSTANFSNWGVLLERNTVYGNSAQRESMARVEYTSGTGNVTAPADLYQIRSNVVWRPVSAAFNLVSKSALANNYALPAGAFDRANHNWLWNNSRTVYDGNAGSNSVEPAAFQNPSVPGINDQTGDPQFADSTRNFLKWCQSVTPGLSTWTACVDELSKRNDASGFNPKFTIGEAMTWLRSGYAPRNLKTLSGAHDAGRVGAVSPVLISHVILP